LHLYLDNVLLIRYIFLMNFGQLLHSYVTPDFWREIISKNNRDYTLFL
jgi:hypothetical protein